MGHPSSKKKRPPSIKDVAELAGVSWSTVSNVIRGHPNVRPETQQRVEDAIRALGYRTNSAGRQLRQGMSNTVVVAVPSLSNPLHAALVEALTVELHQRGLSTALEVTGGDQDLEKRIVEGRLRLAVDGAILLPRGLTASQIARFHSEVPLVVLGEGPGGHTFDTVHPDHRAVARDVVGHLVDEGCEDAVFVGHLAHHPVDQEGTEMAEFVSAMRERGLGIGSGSVVTVPDWDRPSGRLAAQHLASRRQGTAAVVCPDDLLAFGLLRGFAELGTRVPQDIRVVGLGGAQEGLTSSPTLTTVEVDVHATARAAADLVVRRIGDEGAPPIDQVVGHRMRLGESSPASVPEE